MLRLASALARLVSKDTNSPAEPKSEMLSPKKPSLKSKQSWRSASVNVDNRTRTFKCPFSATNALTAATKKEIDAYHSSEEVRARSTDRINLLKEQEAEKTNELFVSSSEREINVQDRINLNARFENKDVIKENDNKIKPSSDMTTNSSENNEEIQLVKSSSITLKGSQKENSEAKTPNYRKTSCSSTIEVYRRRGSSIPMRSRLDSVSSDKLSGLKEKFGTPEKVMHFFGRCFVKFFSNYG